jgi:excisionase family DNA binding protein
MSTRRPPRRRPDPPPPRPAAPAPATNPASAQPSAVEPETAADRLAYSVEETARLTGLSRDLLYDQMRCGNLPYLKVGRRRIITRHHLRQFLGLTTEPAAAQPTTAQERNPWP